MAPASEDMGDVDRPVTHRDLLVTKEALRAEIQAAKEELRAELASKAELQAVKIELRDHIDGSMKSLRDELRTHFNIVAERGGRSHQCIMNRLQIGLLATIQIIDWIKARSLCSLDNTRRIWLLPSILCKLGLAACRREVRTGDRP